MVAQAIAELPNECCGLLAGRTAAAGLDAQATPPGPDLPVVRAERIYPLKNAAASPVKYLSDDEGMFAAWHDMRCLGFEILAIYHSHPISDPIPSRTDREENYYPDAIHLIISLKEPDVRVRGWWLDGETVKEAEWMCVEE